MKFTLEKKRIKIDRIKVNNNNNNNYNNMMNFKTSQN